MTGLPVAVGIGMPASWPKPTQVFLPLSPQSCLPAEPLPQLPWSGSEWGYSMDWPEGYALNRVQAGD